MTSTTSPLFLGLDLSTQQLKGVLIDQDADLVHEAYVHFDKDLPHFGTTHGALSGPDRGQVRSPVAMWVEAIDLLMERLKAGGVDLGRIQSVSGAGQQHGSVYWSHDAESLLASLDPSSSLAANLIPAAFSLPLSPIWQDSSTTAECRALDDAIGGQQALADLTGSRAYERFTGPQIARIRRLQPDAYAATGRISLVSSFIPSLFLGEIAAIEVSDASGMNLMDIMSDKWDDRLLVACGGPELRAKLGPEPVHGGDVLGKVSSWWVKRWGFDPDCLVAPFTGDNPASVTALSTPGDAILSLGTSTTFLLSIPPTDGAPTCFTTSHLLGHPTTAGAHIAMLCYKNGALARERVRNTHADANDASWDAFNAAVTTRAPGNDGYSALYFPLPEIIPPGVHGSFYFKDGQPIPEADFPASAHARAILESQFLSIRARISAILPADAPPLKRLVMTGGASANPTIRQFAADLFGMPAYVAKTKEAAGLGGALLARYSWWRRQGASGALGTFEEMRAGDDQGLEMVAQPKEEVAEVYDGLVEAYERCEEQVVRMCAEA